MQQRILVTGANGHVGQACVRDLLQNGYNVRASVRDIKNAEKTAGLSDLDIDIVEADLFDQESLDRACDGCESVFQLAAIYEFFSNADESIFEKTGTGGYRNHCKQCSTATKGRRRRPRRTSSQNSNKKTCPNCNKQFPKEEFIDRTTRSGKRRLCSDCKIISDRRREEATQRWRSRRW